VNTSIFGGTPAGGTTVGTEGKEFIGWAERAVTVVICANFVAYLFAFKDCMTMGAVQQQKLTPIPGLAGGAYINT